METTFAPMLLLRYNRDWRLNAAAPALPAGRGDSAPGAMAALFPIGVVGSPCAIPWGALARGAL